MASDMEIIHISIEDRLRQTYPQLSVHGFTACQRGGSLDVSLPEWELPPELDTSRISEDARIEVWRNAIRTMGLKASDYRSSIEQLLRRLVRGSPPETGVWFVDAYNALSTYHAAPMGAYDIDRLPTGRVDLRLARRDLDRFTPLGGRLSEFPLKETVAVYASGPEVLCWAFNVRDSQRTCVSPSTHRFLVLSEALDVEGSRRSSEACEAFSRSLGRCGFLVGEPFEIGPLQSEHDLALPVVPEQSQ